MKSNKIVFQSPSVVKVSTPQIKVKDLDKFDNLPKKSNLRKKKLKNILNYDKETKLLESYWELKDISIVEFEQLIREKNIVPELVSEINLEYFLKNLNVKKEIDILNDDIKILKQKQIIVNKNIESLENKYTDLDDEIYNIREEIYNKQKDLINFDDEDLDNGDEESEFEYFPKRCVTGLRYTP